MPEMEKYNQFSYPGENKKYPLPYFKKTSTYYGEKYII